MIAKVPIKEIGIARTGINVVRQCLKKTKITRTTKVKREEKWSLLPL